eukprot:4833972-Alexandrium_andersonii.AAC.1
MSASLVGSEMCIRDSLMAVPFWPLRSWAASAAWFWRRPTQCVCVRKRVPVSYTHLTLPTICSV